MSKVMTESEVEESCLGLLRSLGYDVVYGPDISEGGLAEARKYGEVVLVGRLRDALKRINKSIPDGSIDEAIKKVLRTESQDQVMNNQDFHRLVANGIPVQFKRSDGTIKDELVWLFDFDNVGNNEFLAVDQFTIIEERNNRRPDIILFVNGLLAKAGTLTSNKERFTPWKTIDNQMMPHNVPEIDVLIKGMLKPVTLLDLVRHFVVYEADKDKKDGRVKISKKIAAYQQYNAVNKAIESTVIATKKDHKAGIVWHTQGSGKSLTMVFYAGKMVLHPALENPTIVLLTDRNDLDDQLFGTLADVMSFCGNSLSRQIAEINSKSYFQLAQAA